MMNNRYLFRGKGRDYDGSEFWVTGYLHKTRTKTLIQPTDLFPSEVIPETVGQSTGLKDRNGKLIFEGDVVKLTDNNAEWKAYVVFGNPYGEYNWGWNLMYIGEKPKVNTDILLWVEMEETGAYCEVIGNIYDNPKLLSAISAIIADCAEVEE